MMHNYNQAGTPATAAPASPPGTFGNIQGRLRDLVHRARSLSTTASGLRESICGASAPEASGTDGQLRPAPFGHLNVLEELVSDIGRELEGLQASLTALENVSG